MDEFNSSINWAGEKEPSTPYADPSHSAAHPFTDARSLAPSAYKGGQGHFKHGADIKLARNKLCTAIFRWLHYFFSALWHYCCTCFAVIPILGNLIAISLALMLLYGAGHWPLVQYSAVTALSSLSHVDLALLNCMAVVAFSDSQPVVACIGVVAGMCMYAWSRAPRLAVVYDSSRS